MDDNGVPSMREVSRRLQRMEDRMDARLLTTDVYAAKEIAQSVRMEAAEHRIEALERANSAAVRLLVGAFLGLLVEAAVLAFTLSGRS